MNDYAELKLEIVRLKAELSQAKLEFAQFKFDQFILISKLETKLGVTINEK